MTPPTRFWVMQSLLVALVRQRPRLPLHRGAFFRSSHASLFNELLLFDVPSGRVLTRPLYRLLMNKRLLHHTQQAFIGSFLGFLSVPAGSQWRRESNRQF